MNDHRREPCMRKVSIGFCALLSVALLVLTVLSRVQPMEHTFGSVAQGWLLTIHARDGLLESSFARLITFEQGGDVTSAATSTQISPADGIWACDILVVGQSPKFVPRHHFLGLALKGYRSEGLLSLGGPNGYQPFTGTVDWRELTIPLWMGVWLFASYPVWVVVRGPLRGWRRRRKGLCVHCGYNLHGASTNICPECGKPIDP